jgi:hypothetical protein
MGASSVTGVGTGSTENIKPKILNGAVKAGNIQPQSLESYHGDIDAKSYNGDIYGNNIISSGSITCFGNIVATGYVRGTLPGQILNVSINTSSGTFTNSSSGTFTNIMSVNYTPVYNQSTIMVNFDAGFSMNGSGTDSFRSRIVVSGNPIITRDQTLASGLGNTMRGNTLFPISYSYNNSTTAATTIAVQAAPLVSDDTVTVNKSEAIMTITEIAR